MGKNKFEEFLNKQPEKMIEIDWEAHKDLYIKKVDDFYNQVNLFLKPYGNKISIDDEKYKITEDKLGTYSVKKKVLTIKNNKVLFTPIGAHLLGALGRIDMESENGIVKFVLVPQQSRAPKIESFTYSTEEEKNEWDEKQKKLDEEIKKMPKVWKIATPAPHIHFIDLTEETFFDALMDIIDG